MHNRKIVYPLIAVFVFLLGCVSARAHAGMEHVMGTVTAVTENSVTVETVKHTSVTVLLEPATKFLNSSASVSRQDLKVGDRVVIHAKKNADKKLVAAEVKWGTGSLSADKSMPMEGMGHKH